MSLIRVEHDGFPLETIPPQGKITLVYSDGVKTSFTGFQTDFKIWEEHLRKKNELNVEYSYLLEEYFPSPDSEDLPYVPSSEEEW